VKNWNRSRHRALGEQRRDCFEARDLGGHGAARRNSVWLSSGYDPAELREESERSAAEAGDEFAGAHH